jgi:hypothetical protein
LRHTVVRIYSVEVPDKGTLAHQNLSGEMRKEGGYRPQGSWEESLAVWMTYRFDGGDYTDAVDVEEGVVG